MKEVVQLESRVELAVRERDRWKGDATALGEQHRLAEEEARLRIASLEEQETRAALHQAEGGTQA